MLRQNSRLPDTLMGDLNAQLAACNVGARRLVASLPRCYGAELLMAIFEELLDRSEVMTRQALRAIPEGTYRYVDFMDNDGIDLERPLRDRGRRHRAGRHDRFRPHRNQPAGEGADELRAVGSRRRRTTPCAC